MSAPAIYNPLLKHGVPFWRRLILTDKATGVPLDLTGAVCHGNIRDTAGNVLAAISFIPAADPTTGAIYWGLDDPTVLPATNCLPELPYDVFITPAGVQRLCPVEGLMTVEPKQTVLP